VTRAYELKQRAERQEQTRQRIIGAAIELHQTLGPARTTVTDIADRAGVSRLTVYRHFPDELALGMACSGLYWELHPLPDPEDWRSFPTLASRLRTALAETYAYHRETAPMMSHALADSADSPIMQPYHEHWRHAAIVVAEGGRSGGPEDPMLRAAVGHALAFGTWQSLTRDQELTDQEAIELMLRLVPVGES
jgi:AcrR family transcriptional regulator